MSGKYTLVGKVWILQLEVFTTLVCLHITLHYRDSIIMISIKRIAHAKQYVPEISVCRAI